MSLIKHIFNKESLDQIRTPDIDRLIENETEEFLHLDYEEIPRTDVKYDGLAQHVSGFLNTSGGIIIFGVSEKRKTGRGTPHKITWTTITKETLENNLFQRIEPWCEEIQIYPISNLDATQRIFVIYVPKSKNPPHMANHTYYTRLNFQTKPLGHDQVSSIFRQYYLQKYDLINEVYGPIYNELARFLNKKKIEPWTISEYEQIRKESLFLLRQDVDFYLELDGFYHRISNWNQALSLAPFRLARIINDLASHFFGKQVRFNHGSSAVKFEIRTESTDQFPRIEDAILNRKDPVDFWKENYPFDQIKEITYLLDTYDEKTGERSHEKVSEEQFKGFIEKLKEEVRKDNLIHYIWKEFDEMQSTIEILLGELEDKM